MKILLDLQPLQTHIRYHGIGRVTEEIAKRLINFFTEGITLLFNSEKVGVALDFLRDSKISLKREIFYCPGFESYYQIYNQFPSTYTKLWSFYELMLEYKTAEISPDINFFFYFFAWENLSSLGKIKKNFLNVCLFYDMIPYLFRESYLKSKPVRDFYDYKFKECHLADFYFAISESTKKDMIKLCNIPDDKIEVIPLGCSEKFRELELSEKIQWRQIFQEKYGIKNFILYNPSGADERKNLKRLLKAYSMLPSHLLNNFSLVITSRIDDSRLREFNDYVKELGLTQKVIFTGYVSDDELCALYNLCNLFVFPSFYEGFGLPVLEAMACGAPVLSSNRSSLPEIVVEKDAMFDPDSEREISEKMTKALENSGYRTFLKENAKVQVKRFSYDLAGKKISETLRILQKREEKKYFTDSAKKSLAIVFSSNFQFPELEFKEFLLELSKFYKITLVSKTKNLTKAAQNEVVDFDSFLKKSSDFERVLYILDETDEALEILKTLIFIPGVLVLTASRICEILKGSDIHEEFLYIEGGVTSLIEQRQKGEDNTLSKHGCMKNALNLSLGVIFLSERTFREIKEIYPFVSDELLRFEQIEQSPNALAKRICELIEEFYDRRKTKFVAKELAEKYRDIPSVELQSRIFHLNTKRIIETRRILFDVSILSRVDSGTGIQRVVKAQLSGLINKLPKGYVLNAVRYLEDQKQYVHANAFLSKFTGVKILEGDLPVFFKEGDVLYCPDLNHRGVINAYQSEVYKRAKIAGARIVFLVHDLLPIHFPNYFSEGLNRLHEDWCRIVLEVSDKVVCVSKSVADELKNFAIQRGIDISGKLLITLNNGADFKKAKHLELSDDLESEMFEKVKENPFFLTVSTIEPRKGHRQILHAFEILWQEGYNYNLVFAGKKGWLVDELIDYIKKHPELNRRFFWLGYVSDELLEKLYSHALATIVASEGEGFGLSIVEAAISGCYIIARDIPVFREVGGDGVFYFPNSKSPSQLAESIKEWLRLYRNGLAPKSDKVQWISWEENCKRLIEILID